MFSRQDKACCSNGGLGGGWLGTIGNVLRSIHGTQNHESSFLPGYTYTNVMKTKQWWMLLSKMFDSIFMLGVCDVVLYLIGVCRVMHERKYGSSHHPRADLAANPGAGNAVIRHRVAELYQPPCHPVVVGRRGRRRCCRAGSTAVIVRSRCLHPHSRTETRWAPYWEVDGLMSETWTLHVPSYLYILQSS